jgi:Ca2+-binding RTX toxin-like protein
VTLDFSAETDGKIVVTTSGQALTVTGGALADTVTGGAGSDKFTIAAGATVSKWDTLINWNFDTDKIDIPGAGARTSRDLADHRGCWCR